MDANTEEHHSTEQDLRQHRLEKMERFRGRGDDPFKHAFVRSHALEAARDTFVAAEEAVAEGEAASVPATLAGRVVAMRRQGKSSFGELRDESGQIQVFFNAKSLGDEAYAAIKDLDLGDFIGVEVHRPGVGALLNGMLTQNLSNIRVYSWDAIEVLRDCVADNSLDRLLLFFPDPWHKTHHHKQQIIQPT